NAWAGCHCRGCRNTATEAASDRTGLPAFPGLSALGPTPGGRIRCTFRSGRHRASPAALLDGNQHLALSLLNLESVELALSAPTATIVAPGPRRNHCHVRTPQSRRPAYAARFTVKPCRSLPHGACCAAN